jgi:hypothetical protein
MSSLQSAREILNCEPIFFHFCMSAAPIQARINRYFSNTPDGRT